MFKMMLVAAVVVLPLFSAQAYTLDEIKQLVPELRNIVVKDAKSNDLYLTTAAEAKAICERHGKHVATAREVAQLAYRFGASIVGISEITQIPQQYRNDYVRISTGIVNMEDAFFFSKKHYNNLDVSLLKARFWTSSNVYSFMPTNVVPFMFDGNTGDLAGATAGDTTAAVYCAEGAW